MNKKRLNLKNILNSLMCGVSVVFMALIVCMGFIVPKGDNGAKALSKQDILETYNVSFVSAKTKYRVAEGFGLQQNTSNDMGNQEGLSYAYTYVSNPTSAKLYRETSASSEYNSEYGMVSIQDEDATEIKQYIDVTSTSTYPYIPSNATHFKNVTTNELENVFYDDFDNGDFVLLADNYKISTQTQYNVENVYIAFGSREDDIKLNEVKVQGTLQNATGTYYLSLDEEKRFGNTSGGTEKPPYSCWYQYFDINNIKATTTAEASSQEYNVADASGLYTLTFTFGRQLKNGETAGAGVTVKDGFTSGETFTYSFYLLNSADYSTYPSIHNATLGSTLENETNEYFYHFEGNKPSIIYSPNRYNLSYVRQNNEISDNITSTFQTATSIVDGSTYEYGKITFYNNEEYYRDVYIFSKYLNDKKDTLEYIYASCTNPNLSISNYNDIFNLFENDTLKFEYKLVKVLTKSTSGQDATFTTTTYYTNNYSLCNFSTGTFDSTGYTLYNSFIPNIVDTATIVSTENLATTDHVTSAIDSTHYTFTTAGKTSTQLKRMLNIDTIDVDYSYMLEFDDLGVYDFTYSYVCPWYSIDNSEEKINYTASSSITPYDYTLVYTNVGTPETKTENKSLYTMISGYLNEQNQVSLLGYTYTYNKKNTDPLTDNSSHNYNFTSTYQLTIDSTEVNGVKFSIEEESSRLKLNILIPIGSLSTLEQSYTSSTTGTYNQKFTEKVTYDYTLSGINADNISASKEALSYLRSLLQNIASQDSADSVNNRFYPVTSTSYKSHTLGKDKLTIFGSVAYFSKVNTTTDSGYSKLEQVDSKENKNFISDYTSLYLSKTSNTPTSKFSKVLGLSTEQIIVTDTQVFWKNYSSLLYGTGNNNKISQSKIYKYTNYKDRNGNIDLDNASVSEYSNKNTYFKDIYCKDDGYYEVIIKYTYNFYKTSNAIAATTQFYQLFVFIIDNSSPTLTFEEQVSEGNYRNLTPNSYTNKVVRISWAVPTYFKNNVYIEVSKTNFAGNTTDMPFVAKYDGENGVGESGITVTSGALSYVKGISNFKKSDDRNTYYLTLAVPSENSEIWNLDGHYSVTIYFGPENIDGDKPSFTQKYTFDGKDISGMQALPVTKDDSGAYVINEDLASSLKENAQILNTDFTFRYSAKASGAMITTYYHKISLDITSEYNKLISLANNKAGITTNYYINGSDASLTTGTGNPYKYAYENGNIVANGNYLSSNTSCIYLFKMEDEAGNTARYVVFYDTTSPRFVVSPLPTGSNNIVSDVTSIMWGDYKAIKISGVAGALIEGMNQYTISTESNKLIEALSYINNYSENNNCFNNTRIEKVGSDYYLLVPIVKAQITDEDNNNSVITDTTNYYLFPNDPKGSDNTIKLPVIDENGQVEMVGSSIKTENREYSLLQTDETKNYFDEVSRTYIYALLTDGTKVRGVNGTGLYYYSVYDELGNSNMGDLWMNLDKTQTLAYATFNYTDDRSKAVGLTGESASSYSASKLYISSLENIDSTNPVIPEYTITYSFFAYDAEFYNNYQIIGAEYKTSDTDGDESAYIEFTFRSLSDTSKTVTRQMQVYDRLGNRIQPVSYPYSMKSTSQESDETTSIYKTAGYSGTENVDSNIQRVYSGIINSTNNINGQSVTKEGLYIFKREYADTVEDSTLGNDSRIIYRVYYIDRSGIISYIPTSSQVANALYGTGNDIQFLLGSTYTTASNQKLITASNIQNNQTSSGSENASNSSYSSYNLFSTNKVQTKFTLTLDKFNYNKFAQNYSSLLDTYASDDDLKDALSKYLLNDSLFTSLFKLDLTLKKGSSGTKIIDESNIDVSSRYNSALMSKYISEYKTSTNITERGNELSFFYGDALNSYYITLNDQSGHIERTYNEATNSYETTSINAGANDLNISFMIKHVAPSGDMYGKYYGNPSISYDEKQNGSNTSVPITTEDNGDQKKGTYALISKYLNDSKGSLKQLSTTQNVITTIAGSTVTLSSTNNETLVFLFAISNDDYMSKIDMNNIQVYQNSIDDAHLLFNRYESNGSVYNHTTSLVPSQDRQDGSFICNIIDGVTYYAIIIFDNNLDDILEEGDDANNYRLLDSNSNLDEATYYISIHYIGDSDDYKAELNGDTVSYYNSTYEITIDRVKPMYNLVRLMELDKYTYKGNTTASAVTSTNYSSMFDYYKGYYNFEYNEETDFYNSDLETYFFAVDSRESSAFSFKSVDKLDSNGGFYIRPLGTDISNYKFSYTPDDYTIYNDAELRGEHNQFMPNDKTPILFNGTTKYSPAKFEIDKYYFCPYLDGEMSVSLMLKQGIVEANNYYEIIECDEAENYRVYGIYIHDATSDSVSYEYQTYSGTSYKANTINYNNSTALVSGISFSLLKNGFADYAYITNDLFIKAKIQITSDNINESLYLYYMPSEKALKLTDTNNNVKEIITDIDEYKLDFVTLINKIINNYKNKVLDTYGYTIEITIVDRLGIPATYDRTILNDYVITYSVAGNELQPIFKTSENGTTFVMTIPSQKGSTYIVSVEASQFNQTWIDKNVDAKGNQFRQHVNEFKKGVQFVLSKGVYRFVITDNFGRSTVYFYEFGISSSNTGGSIKYYGEHSTHSDGFTYTYENFVYSYDSSIYNVFIRYTGEDSNTGDFFTSEEIFGVNSDYSEDELTRFGISSIITENKITKITFTGISGTRFISKYEIKTILASTADGYQWGDEESNSNIFVYDNKVAVQKAIQQVSVRNMKGINLDTSTTLYLTDDFQLVLDWGLVLSADQVNFGTQILLTRTFTENGVSKTTTFKVDSGYVVSLPGSYTARAVNNLGNSSDTVSFTRGEGEISSSALYAVSENGKVQTKLTPATYTTLDSDKKSQYHYFITDDYFTYIDSYSGEALHPSDLDNIDPSVITINKNADKYIDVRVNSNLNLVAEIIETPSDLISNVDDRYDYIITYKIYSGDYVYRYLILHFLPGDANYLVDTEVVDVGTDTNKLLADGHIVQSVSKNGVKVTFTELTDSYEKYTTVIGNTLYLDRYYNGTLVETVVLNTIKPVDGKITHTFTITTVGLHQFAIRDLAGRTHLFGNASKNSSSNLLSVYLINQVLYEVNDSTPINNQVFNESVKITVINKINDIVLYNTESLGITIYKNGSQIDSPSENGVFTISEQGYYTIELVGITQLSSIDVTNQEVTSRFSFVIIRDDIAKNSFNISKGTNFVIDKITKTMAGEVYDVTDDFKTSPNGITSDASNYASSLIWLYYTEQQNSKFDISLKSYNTITGLYDTFSFKIWINETKPVLHSNISAGEQTRDTIEVYYNAGLLYEEVGVCRIEINGNKYVEINKDSETVVSTITISNAGEYNIKIVSDDGAVLCSYKFIKVDPLNSTTKFIIVIAVIAVAVVVVLFFLIRKKGKYR